MNFHPLKGDSFKGILGPVRPLQLFTALGFGRVNARRFLRTSLISLFPGLLQGDIRVRPKGQQAFLAVIPAVFQLPVLATRRSNL